MPRISGLGCALVFVLLAGCAGLHHLEAFQDAREHMLTASELENGRQYPEALRKYVHVARNFPSVSYYYKTAVFKAAMLSGRQDNPERNLGESLYWLNEYLKLPLSEQEHESVQFVVALIEQNERNQEQVAQLQSAYQKKQAAVSQKDTAIDALELQAKKLAGRICHLQKELASYEERIKERDEQILQLEAEISKAQDALERIKEIDVRIHQRRLK